mgnify:CR=1 FL=1
MILAAIDCCLHQAARRHQPDRHRLRPVVLHGMLGAQRMPGWTALFLATTVLTSVTGFMFPPLPLRHGERSSDAISLAVLARGAACPLCVQANGAGDGSMSSALFALYLNVFVLVVQAFQKIAFLHSLANALDDRRSPGGPDRRTAVHLPVAGVWRGAKFHPEAMAPARR